MPLSQLHTYRVTCDAPECKGTTRHTTMVFEAADEKEAMAHIRNTGWQFTAIDASITGNTLRGSLRVTCPACVRAQQKGGEG